MRNPLLCKGRWAVGTVLLSLALAGCGGAARRPLRTGPEAATWARQGDAAYGRMSWRDALRAYRKAESFGLEDGIVSYRIDFLRRVTKETPARRGRPFRERSLRLLKWMVRSPRRRPIAYYYLAEVLADGKKGGEDPRRRLYAEAVALFETGRFKGLTAEGRVYLGRMHRFLGRGARAEKLFLEAQRLAPRLALAAFELGRLYQRAGRHREAVAQLRRFVRLVPNDAEGRALLGESAYEAGQYARAAKSFEAALALDSLNGAARDGFRRAKAALRRRSLLKRETKRLVWDVGFRTRLKPLTLAGDGLTLGGRGSGPPAVGANGKVFFASASGRRFDLYALSPDSIRLRRLAVSRSGFVSRGEGADDVLLSLDRGPRREIGFYGPGRGVFRSRYRGRCRQPNFDAATRTLACAGDGGVILVNVGTGKAWTLSREPLARHPRLGRGGEDVLVALGREILWLDRSGKEKARFGGFAREEEASFPDLSADGRWIVSGSGGLHLTSVKEGATVALRHPALAGAGRAVFGPRGRTLVFVKGGRLYRLSLPERLGAFFTLLRARRLVGEKRYGRAIRLLKRRPEKTRPAYFLLLGRSLMGLGLDREAAAAARRALALDPKDWRGALFLGRLRLRQGDRAGAVADFTRVVSLQPGRFEGYLARAKAHASGGRLEEALEDFRAALGAMKGDPGPGGDEVVKGLLEIYVKQGRLDEALLLLLDHGERLRPASLKEVRKAPAFSPLQKDPRFREVLGLPTLAKDKASGQEAPAAAAAPPEAGRFKPYRAKVFVDDNPNPIDSVVVAEDGEVVTIQAFGLIQKYPRERLRIVR